MSIEVQKQHNDLLSLEEFIEATIAELSCATDETNAVHIVATELGYKTVVELVGNILWGIAAAKVAAVDTKKEIRRLLSEVDGGTN